MEEWVIISGDRVIKRFTVAEGQCLMIGRDPKADVVISNSAISRKQTSIELRNGDYYLRDQHSLNGTKVNGVLITSETMVRPKDLIEVGRFILKPAGLVGAVAEAASVAAGISDEESFNKTLYVSGIYKSTQYGRKKSTGREFTLKVVAGKGTPAVLVMRGNKTFTVGKSPDCSLVISGRMIGPLHFEVECRRGACYIREHGGLLRKTRVNGQKLKGERRLKSRDLIQAGEVKLRFG